jgi:hypothetical protein
VLSKDFSEARLRSYRRWSRIGFVCQFDTLQANRAVLHNQ